MFQIFLKLGGIFWMLRKPRRKTAERYVHPAGDDSNGEQSRQHAAPSTDTDGNANQGQGPAQSSSPRGVDLNLLETIDIIIRMAAGIFTILGVIIVLLLER